MKAKKLFKKSLALIIAMALIVLSVPMSIFMASAEAAPAPDATDIGGKLVVSSTEALYNDFADDGVFTLGRTQGARFLDPVFGTGVVYASAKFKMNGNVHYNWSADGETGEYGYSGNYNNLGFDLGTATLGDGTTFVLHLSYRRNQGIYIMADSSCSKFVKTTGATANLDELTLTVKYDPATYTFSIWENGTQKGDISYADAVDPAATDASKITAITMNHFGIHNSDLGYTAENPEDVTNGNKTENTVTVSDVHLWGDVTLSPKTATKAPTVGANSTDITANVTLSDAAMNEDWKADGKFAWAVAQNQYYTFNGIDFTKGNNKIVYATATFTNRASGGDSTGMYGTVFTSAGDYNYLRPAWNQQGFAKYNAQQLIGNVVPEGNGSLKGDVWKVTYKWDVDNDVVDIWLTTQFHAGFDWPEGYGFNATFYMGKYYLKDCAPQFGLRTRPEAPQLTGTVNVQDVRVWEETAAATEGGSTTNMATSSDVWVGGTLNDNLNNQGAGANVLTTMPTFTPGSTLATGDTYVTTQSAGLYSLPHAMVWSDLAGDLSKGTITYEADVTLFTSNSGTRLLGFIPCTVNGHYVSMGLGFHYSADGYYPKTLINMGTDDNARNATATLLGCAWDQNISGVANVVGTDTGTTAHIKYVLSEDALMFYVNGKLAQYADLTGKTVVPTFMFGWASGNASDYISNVQIYGDGIYNPFAGENLIGETTAYVGGQFVSGTTSNVLVTTPVMNAGDEIDTDGVYAATGVGGRAKKTIVWKGLGFDLNKGGVVIEGKLTLNPSTIAGEIHNGFVPCTVDGHYVVMGLGYHTYNGKSDYTPQTFINAGNMNEASATQTVLGGSATSNSVTVAATDAPGIADIKIALTSTNLKMYVNGKLAQTYDLTGKTVVPTFGFVWSTGNAADTLSEVKIYGAGVSVCTHEYDNDADEDCNVCGATRVAPGKVLPTIGENTNFAGDLVFENAGANAEYAENGTITTSGLNGKANGVLLNENGTAYIKTDITFNGNVDWNWVGTTSEETGETTYSYKEAWGRTGVQIGTYYSTGREKRMPVFVTYRRCSGGVYVWDEAQEVNGSGNPVVVGSIAKNKEPSISLVVKYDSVTSSVTVWVDGAFVGTASLEAFGEFEFALGVTQYGSGTTAVDPSDNTNPETTPNSVTFSNFEVWGDLTATCVHVYDNACDAECNNCGEIREVAGHVYDDDCADTDCNNCGAIRDAAEHVYDDDCQDTTCANCGVTRPAAEHVYDDDCQDTTCANCSVTREPAEHVYENACDTTCDNCSVIREVGDHVYDDEYDAECNECGNIREVADRVVIGDVEIALKPDDKLPEKGMLEDTTKYILGWKNPDGSTYEGDTYAPGLVAEFIETKMMTVKYQLGLEGNSIRYIASVDETERYSKVGWAFSLVNTNPEIGAQNVVVRESNYVYNSILANGVEKSTADIYGDVDYSNYFYVFELTDIPEANADDIIYVRPYVELNDGTIVYGEVSAQSLNGVKALGE